MTVPADARPSPEEHELSVEQDRRRRALRSRMASDRLAGQGQSAAVYPALIRHQALQPRRRKAGCATHSRRTRARICGRACLRRPSASAAAVARTREP
jgi:hypothetical protein